MEANRMRILVIDVGSTHVKVLATGHKKLVEIPSGLKMTLAKMVAAVRAAASDWKYDAVSIGYPGPVLHGRPIIEPRYLGPGWVGFNFKRRLTGQQRSSMTRLCKRWAVTKAVGCSFLVWAPDLVPP
jgi:predicted NBD/HSP70 family sugar kinase